MSSFKSRIEFIRNNKPSEGVRKVGLVEYIKELDNAGMTKNQIQRSMINDNVSSSVRMSEEDFRYYKKVKPTIGWM